MRRTCGFCGQATIACREIDNMSRIVDATPTTEVDAVVLRGDIDDQPTALWGIDPGGDDFWKIPAGVPRYRRHVCPEGQR